MEKARDLIMVIAKALVQYPEQVSINVRSLEKTVFFELKTAKSDIGKQGRTADAIRILRGARGGKIHTEMHHIRSS